LTTVANKIDVKKGSY